MSKYYAVKNKNDEIRLKSSSGGVFITLARKIIDKKGIVYGVVYDEKFNVIHERIENKDELLRLCGSKYVKSDLNNCFSKVKTDLQNNKIVLFSGTPCQIYALKKYLSKINTEKLLLVDIICHGTPAVNYFNEYKKYMEQKHKSKIAYINMRYKDEKVFYKNYTKKHNFLGNVEPHIMFIKFKNKKKYVMPSKFDEFYRLFDFFTTEGCFNCPFSNLNRLSDITIGDFHEFSSKLRDFNDGNGVSLVIVNTEKGEDFFNRLDEFELKEKKAEECLQPALEVPMKRPINYDEFQEDYKKYGFNFVVKKYIKINKLKKFLYKIGLLDFLSNLKKGWFKI